jgi:hypothetical protein
MKSVSIPKGRGFRTGASRLLPPGTKRRAAVSKLVDRTAAKDDGAYQRWIQHGEKAAAAPLADPAVGPLISVVVPAFNTPDEYLVPMVNSVIAQSYGRWELCLVDGGNDPERSLAMRRHADRDDRIRLVALGGNRGIAGNTNAGLDVARGNYVAFLDHDDELAPFALNEVAAALRVDPDIDLLYSDEDKLAQQGHRRSLPFFKPGWSPDLFLCVNYLAHFVVARASLVETVGGIRPGYEGAQDYDFLLRTLQHAPRIHHIPRISYHWRMGKGSTARSPEGKSHAEKAGCRALSDHLARRGITAGVEPGPHTTNYRVRYHLPVRPTVHFFAPGRSPAGVVASTAALDELRLDPEPVEGLAGLPASDFVLILEVAGPPQGAQWLKELVAVASQPGVGAVAPALRTRAGRHSGTGYVANQGKLRTLCPGEALDRWTRMSHTGWARNLVAVGGIGVLRVGVAQKLLAAGARTDLVSLSLTAHRLGLRNIHWPFAEFIAEEKLQPLVLPEPVDDPFVNPNALLLAPG